MMTITDFRVQKRTVQRLSCAVCRRRKLRCDRRRPCRRCIDSKCTHLCIYRDSSPDGGKTTAREVDPPRNSSSAGVRHVPAPDRQIEPTTASELRKLDALQLNHSMEQSKDPSTRSQVPGRIDGLGTVDVLDNYPHGKHDNTHVWGRSHWASLIGKFTDVMRVASENREKVKSYYKASKAKCSPEPDTLVQSSVLRLQRSWIPPPHIAEPLISRYLETFGYSHRVLHVPSFLDSVDSILSQASSSCPFSLSCFLSALAIANCFSNGEDNIYSSMIDRKVILEWLENIQLWLQASWPTRKISIQALQSRYLLLLACQVCGRDHDRSWLSSGMLIREAIAFGLHRDPAAFYSMTVFQREMRRRLWVAIVEAEVQSSLISGLPPCISLDSFDVLPPPNIDDEDISENSTSNPEPKAPSTFTRASYQITQYQMLDVRIQAATILNRIKPLSYEEVMRLSARVIGSTDAMSRLLISDNGASVVNHSTRSFLVSHFNVITHRLLLALHRPFAMKGAHDSGFHYSRIRCLSSSLTLLDFLGVCVSRESNARHDRPLAALSGGYLIDDLFNSTLSLCLELMLERVDESLLGHPLPATFPLDLSGRGCDNYHSEHLIRVVGDCIAVLELWTSHEKKDFKKYMFLVMAIASVKSRMAGCESLDGVSQALWQSLGRYNKTVERISSAASGNKESEISEPSPLPPNRLPSSSVVGHGDLQPPTPDFFLDIGGIDWDSDSWDFLTAFTSAEVYDDAAI
ncbi:fungal specific transcription factor domain-containing protein [Aspergillus ibericus CBS 121593]|uniref:Zn(2)-C6 fungal-type domain-containing protein n=1 Tax=Aspergillus ibericus CBS 121593 TaxID=1448316 RepID=A0A395GJS0_9EURO|nr:hypothetical protein BO80DRAFT_430000 [Aspergillus ibericus CBS 121593]RAK95288.1 hypothetical protein BO80DRAFT_430000 [Aspergillus ibericus CBS 121593]